MQRAQGYSQQGNTHVTTSGLLSTNVVEGSYPLCTITVYLAGTLTLATLYSDDISTPLANPFTASSTGLWFFYAVNGRYDVKFSGTGIVSPFTLGDILLADPASGPITIPVPISQGGTGQVTRITAKLPAGLNFPFVVAGDFDFAPVSPTVPATLSIGTNPVVFATVPYGFAIGNYVYVYNTGTPEFGQITGISGNIVSINCAHTHAAGYSIRSVSGGIQEAAQYVSTTYVQGWVMVSAGTTHIYGPTNIPTGVYVTGTGVDSTLLLTMLVDGDVFHLNGGGCGVAGLTIDSNISGRTGVGILSDSDSTHVFYIYNLKVYQQGVGVSAHSPGYLLQVIVGYCFDTGIVLDSSEIYVNEVQSNSNVNYGIKFLSGTGIYMQHPQATQNGISNFFITGSAPNMLILSDQLVSSLSGTSHGVDLRGAGGNLNFYMTNAFVEQSGRVGSGTQNCAGVVWEAAGSIQIIGGSIAGSTGPGIVAGPSGGVTNALVINGVIINGNGMDVSDTGDNVGIKLAGTIAWESITGNVLKSAQISPGVYKQVYAFRVSASTVANGLLITSNYVDAHTAPFYPQTTGAYQALNRELQIQPNYWSITALPTYASTATLLIATHDTSVLITGTVTVTTLGDAWLNRVVTVIKKDAGSVTVMGRVLTQNNKITLTFDGTNWI